MSRSERGAAAVDFVLAMVVLVPLVLGIIQVALVLHVRSTLASAASEGARLAATYDGDLSVGVARTKAQIQTALAARFAREVDASYAVVDGLSVVRVEVAAAVPALGLWGPSLRVKVQGHALREPR